MKIKTILICFALLLLPVILDAHILNLNSGENVSLDMMLDDLSEAQVIFIGELHDNDDHHKAQLDIIHALRLREHKVVIGMEMFQADYQHDLDRWVSGELDNIEFLKIYQENWSMWPQYDDIFYYAQRESVPMLGLNVDRSITRKVMKAGFASLADEELAELPMVRCDVAPLYKEYMRKALHGHLDQGSAFDFFCEAQLVWDKSMAFNLKQYMEKHDDVLVVVLAGSGHAWKHGIPQQLEKLTGGSVKMRVVLPQLPGNMHTKMATGGEADYLLQGLEFGSVH